MPRVNSSHVLGDYTKWYNRFHIDLPSHVSFEFDCSRRIEGLDPSDGPLDELEPTADLTLRNHH